MIFAEVIYKKRTIICKKQTWFDFFVIFSNFPYFKQGLFLFIFILAGNKGN